MYFGCLVVFLDHALHNRVNLALFSDILLVGLFTELIVVVNLLLNVPLVLLSVLKLLLHFFHVANLTKFLVSQHLHVNRSVFFNFDLASELLLSHLL